MSPQRIIARRKVIGASLALAATSPGRAQAADTAVKITLDLRLNGANAPFLYALDQGLFHAEGVDATCDSSAGSGDAISRVASGTYDFGYADLGTLVDFCARNPGASPVMVMTIQDIAPHCIVGFKKSGMRSLKDLIGHKVGTGVSDATARLLPALLRLNGVELSQLDLVRVDQKLRETMLARGVVEAVAGYDHTIIFNLVSAGVQPSDMTTIYFAENGFDFYGNGLIASRRVIAEDPALVARTARAVARGFVAASRDPAAAAQSLLRRDPVIDAKLESDRLVWMLRHAMLTTRVRTGGMGQFDPARAEAGLTLITDSFGLPRRPAVSELYDGRFVPALTDRTGFANL